MSWQVLNGDNLAWMSVLPDASVDAVVCDPPYGLSVEPDMREVLEHWLAGDDYRHRGGGFMGRSWDSFVPGPTTWQQCARVLKPGGHLLAFGGTRTYDLLVTAIRLAGLEIRDTIAWMYGAGFPKSLDVSKAIDRHLGQPRVGGRGAPVDRRVLDAGGGSGKAKNGLKAEWDRGAPNTPQAAAWEGWGTALKPAFEPVVVARKPLDGTVAATVLEHGTGGLNVDACRIGWGPDGDRSAQRKAAGLSDRAAGALGAVVAAQNASGFTGDPSGADSTAGRWPANVVLDPAAGAMLDAQTGELRSGDGNTIRQSGADHDGNRSAAFGAESRRAGEVMVSYGDRGGASRFFYCAKASPDEREAGAEGLPRATTPLTSTPTSTLQHGRAGGERVDDRVPERRAYANDHPTVKPIELMRWLVRLVTPPGGVVLDPFCGSGSTGCAAVLEGVGFLGVDRDEHYCDLAIARIGWWAAQKPRPASVTLRARAEANARRDGLAGGGQLALEAL